MSKKLACAAIVAFWAAALLLFAWIIQEAPTR
jgi:hypothetical protein